MDDGSAIARSIDRTLEKIFFCCNSIPSEAINLSYYFGLAHRTPITLIDTSKDAINGESIPPTPTNEKKSFNRKKNISPSSFFPDFVLLPYFPDTASNAKAKS